MKINEIKEKYGHFQSDANVMAFAVPVSYSGRDVIVVKANTPEEAVNAAEKLVEGRFMKAPLRLNSIKSDKPKRTGVFG